MINVKDLKKEIQKRDGKNKKDVQDMTKIEIVRCMDERRRPLIKEHEYQDYNIPTSYTRIDFHNTFEVIFYLGGCCFTWEEYKQIDSFTNQLKTYYETIIQSYQRVENTATSNKKFQKNVMFYFNILEKLQDFLADLALKKKRQIHNNLNLKKILVPNKKKNLPHYLYPLKKMYPKEEIESIGHFAIFLAELVQGVQFYGLILKPEELHSLRIILEASQNAKFQSFIKKSLEHRFYEFLCSIAELKCIPGGKELLFDKIQKR
jgi:hypothetical protein